ncbi:MAG: 1-deoxy-D-xylulose-5-phosphate synthase [Proteobacteria bacterium]|nr:1-deoxy-D-xylulose-5-phosphate synthase [Pseudomonadota bacterium]
MNAIACPLLELVETPADLRALPPAVLPRLADELRSCLIGSVAESGGHFAAGLGTVELTIALHYLFDTPADALVWDVGHQCYPHKILTGRRARLPAIRRRGGPSGFLRRDESPYDAFGAGHSSTSISAALGIAVANARLGRDRRAVAIIGDGGLTAGLAFEALDHAGATGADLLVVLNDNRMSISPNVGALSECLRDRAGTGGAAAWFEGLGFEYRGPVDGHDLPALLAAIGDVRSRRGPRLLHVVTQKGRGYRPAERDPIKYHGVTPFDVENGTLTGAGSAQPTYTQLFGDWLCEAAERDPRIVAITPAMREGSGLVRFASRFPDRYFDVGIAEQHAVTFAAGLAAQGLRPVVAIYSTFLQRAYDQLVHDVALQKLPVLFAIDRAGLVGPDGATHNGGLDLSFLRCVPGLTVMAPTDGEELRNMLHTGIGLDGPAAVRYPRALTTAPAPGAPLVTLPHGASEVRRNGSSIAILAFGTLLATAMDVAEEIDATVVNMRYVKPLDARRVAELARGHELLVTLEESALAGGAGAAVTECLAARGLAVPVLNLGLPDAFIEHGTRDEALADARLDRAAVLAAIEARRAQLEPEVETGPRRSFGSFALGSALSRARLR